MGKSLPSPLRFTLKVVGVYLGSVFRSKTTVRLGLAGRGNELVREGDGAVENAIKQSRSTAAGRTELIE